MRRRAAEAATLDEEHHVDTFALVWVRVVSAPVVMSSVGTRH